MADSLPPGKAVDAYGGLPDLTGGLNVSASYEGASSEGESNYTYFYYYDTDTGVDGEDGSRFWRPWLFATLVAACGLIIAACGLICWVCDCWVCDIGSLREPLLRAWHRRQACKAAARMAGRDGELTPVAYWGVTTQPVKVKIEMDGMTHTIGASRDGITSVSRLPFVLTEACMESGFPELARLDLVDLLISRRAELALVDESGTSHIVQGTMSTAQLACAKSFLVKVKVDSAP